VCVCAVCSLVSGEFRMAGSALSAVDALIDLDKATGLSHPAKATATAGE
jgi:hypothetical protein